MGSKHRKAALDLRAEVAQMIRTGCSKRQIRIHIQGNTACTGAEKLELLKELHMEWSEET